MGYSSVVGVLNFSEAGVTRAAASDALAYSCQKIGLAVAIVGFIAKHS